MVHGFRNTYNSKTYTRGSSMSIADMVLYEVELLAFNIVGAYNERLDLALRRLSRTGETYTINGKEVKFTDGSVIYYW